MLNLLESRSGGDGKGELLGHCSRARDIFDPISVVDNVGDLYGAVRVHASEDRVQEGYVLDYEIDAVDLDPVTDIIRVLNEQEDTGPSELLDCTREREGERHQGGGVKRHVLEEVLGEERS